MLPSEAAVAQHIAVQFQQQFQSMEELHNAVVGMFGGPWHITKPRGTSRFTVETVAGLLTKACKTYRAVHMVCAAGLGTDGGVLARSLFETTIAILFIMQKRSKERAVLYHAYGAEQRLKMLNHWKRTKGLKRMATKRMIANQTEELDGLMKELPPGANAKRHWSGLANFEASVNSLKAAQLYAVFYRHTSSFAHGPDFQEHVTIDPVSGDFTFELEPTGNHIDSTVAVSRLLLWAAADRINGRLGLGFDAVLAPLRPPKTSRSEPPPASWHASPQR
jgi:hypothetical protein